MGKSIVYSFAITMSKRRKTKQEKIIADLRRKVSENTTQAPLLQVYHQPTEPPVMETQSVNLYAIPRSYVYHDLRKTAAVSITLLLFEILLFILFKNHVLAFPGGSF